MKKEFENVDQIQEAYSQLRQRESELMQYYANDRRFRYSNEWVKLLDEYHNVDAGVNNFLENNPGKVATDLLATIETYYDREHQAIDKLQKILNDPTTSSISKIDEVTKFSLDPIHYAYINASFGDKDKISSIKSLGEVVTQANASLIDSVSFEIKSESARLFLQFPEDEMVNPKDNKCPNYLKIAQYYNYISTVVQQSILREQKNENEYALRDDPHSHAKLKYFWIMVASKLYDTSDFSSYRSVMSGIDTVPVYRLNKDNNGLSENVQSCEEAKERYGFLSAECIKTLQDDDYQGRENVVPFLGRYRTSLDKTSSGLQIVDGNEKATTERVKLAYQVHEENKERIKSILTNFQKQFSAEQDNSGVKSVKFTTVPEIFSDLKKVKEFDDDSYKILPRGESGFQFDTKYHPLDMLENRKLADFIFKNGLTFNKSIDQSAVEDINSFCRLKNRKELEFKEMLLGDNIFDFKDGQKAQLEEMIPEFFAENAQVFYKSKITNKTLLSVLKDKDLHDNQLGASTTKTVETVNSLYEQLQQSANKQGKDYRALLADFHNKIGRLGVTLVDQDMQVLNLPIGDVAPMINPSSTSSSRFFGGRGSRVNSTMNPEEPRDNQAPKPQK